MAQAVKAAKRRTAVSVPDRDCDGQILLFLSGFSADQPEIYRPVPAQTRMHVVRAGARKMTSTWSKNITNSPFAVAISNA
uniref:Uncharacterized protein n=1 Tax=Oryza brachyantha TaxID=4533 RepID=J3M030_ORYBR